MSRVWSGQSSLEKRLKAIQSPRAQKLLGAALFDIGEDVKDAMQGSIMSGSAAGQSGGKHQHVRSKPGEPPQNEFGTLHNNIEVTQPADDEVIVASNAAHSVPLEFGTSKMAARPFARPARDKNRRPGRKKMAAAVNQIIKGVAD
jgi:HK97 gp10 family phage protein